MHLRRTPFSAPQITLPWILSLRYLNTWWFHRTDTASFFRRQPEAMTTFLAFTLPRSLLSCRLYRSGRPKCRFQGSRRLCLRRLLASSFTLCVCPNPDLPTPPTVEPTPPTKSPLLSFPTPSPTPPVTSLAVSPTPFVTPLRALPGRPPPPGREPVTLLPTPSTVDPTPFPAPDTVLPTPPPAPEAAPFRLPLPSAPVVSPTVLLTPDVVLDKVFPTLSVVLPMVFPAGPPIVLPVFLVSPNSRTSQLQSVTYRDSFRRRQRACWLLRQHRSLSSRLRYQLLQPLHPRLCRDRRRYP
jgi:hypothetical protein